MVWLLWIFVVGSGGVMGVASALSLATRGFDLVVALNAALYLGVALYGAPRLLRLISNATRRGPR